MITIVLRPTNERLYLTDELALSWAATNLARVIFGSGTGAGVLGNPDDILPDQRNLGRSDRRLRRTGPPIRLAFPGTDGTFYP